MSDELMELPEGWEWTKIGDVTDIIMGQSPPGDSYNQEGKGIPLINGPVEFGPLPFSKTVKSKFTTLPTKMCKEGDLILCVRGSTTGRMNISGFEACIGRGVAAFRAHCYQPYLNFVVHSKQEEIYRLGTGSTFPNVSADVLSKILIPLPPLNEQKRIVAKIEELRERSQKARSQLSAIPGLCDRFRQSVLAAAFRGDLTADWREQNPDVEPASVLLGETDDALPDTWLSASIGDVIESLKYGTSQKCDYSIEGTPVLRIPNVSNGVIDHADLKCAELPPKELEELKLIPGDILIIRSNGSVSLVGKSAVVREAEEGFAYAGYLIRLRLNQTLTNPYYLHLCLSSRALRLQIEVPARSTSGVNNINSQEVKRLRISLPPLREQKEIVCQVDQFLQIISHLEQQYKDAETYLNQLDRSILAKAFRGELVEQDPNDEPASVLLERIRAEREQLGQSGKTSRKTNRKTKP